MMIVRVENQSVWGAITKDLFNEPMKWSSNKSGKMVIYATYGIFKQMKWSEMDYISDNTSVQDKIGTV